MFHWSEMAIIDLLWQLRGILKSLDWWITRNIFLNTLDPIYLILWFATTNTELCLFPLSLVTLTHLFRIIEVKYNSDVALRVQYITLNATI